ncbi:MAG TPA: hypothetical protein VLH60_07335, partial [Sedimentisphaerales bacterium]|nr:hypothetical protein [Sedimentisphaerales bacterium]
FSTAVPPAPTPNPMGFLAVPTQVLLSDGFYHTMTAMTAVDSTGSSVGVEYYFQCVTYPEISSGWISSSSYSVRVGAIGWPKTYDWRVRARDVWGNVTQWSPGFRAGGN